MQGVPIVAVGVAIVGVTPPVSAVVIHGMVMDTGAIRTGMIATDPTHVATHCHAADMNASAEPAHVSTTADTSAVTATTSAAAPRIGRADSQCGGKRGRSHDHHHS